MCNEFLKGGTLLYHCIILNRLKVLWRSGGNPLTLQAEQSAEMGSISDRDPALECHDKGSWTQLAPSCSCDPSAALGAEKTATSLYANSTGLLRFMYLSVPM